MSAHPRVALHQVAFVGQSTAAFVDHCRAIGVRNMTLVTPLLMTAADIAAARGAIAAGDLQAPVISHAFGRSPDLEHDDGGAAAGLDQAIDLAISLGSHTVYLVSGGRGSLDWETAAARFTDLLAPGRERAAAHGIRLLVENAGCFNVDIHLAHTLGDALKLAEIAGIGLCIDLQPCWTESALKETFARALPITGFIQVSDYVLGDRSAPCRAVPGDGAVPLEQLIADLLGLGYDGLFDLELVGPRIAAEGPREATRRAVDWLSETLTRLGA